MANEPIDDEQISGIVDFIISGMRGNPPKTLEAAAKKVVRTMRGTPGLDVLIAHARSRIQEQIDRVVNAPEPRAVIEEHETWYPGPDDSDVYWPPLCERLAEQLEPDDLRSLDDASSKIVAHLPCPAKLDFRSYGLVLGYVQSGKTTNFTSVIAKAADAGYRFFIVLSGMHNSLRVQTQVRLNRQLFDLNRPQWYRLTNDDDFTASDNVDSVLQNANGRVVLAVVKKNAARLRRLLKWLKGASGRTLASCPVLIIDDEADQGSINTAAAGHRASVINGLIRQIIEVCPRSAYVGYTATPFANILIDPSTEDLYPRDFIIDLPKPKAYLGPESLFGRNLLEYEEDEMVDDGLDLIRHIDDQDALALRSAPSAVPSSLDEAVRYFLLSTAARRIRRTGHRHATALIHTSQRTEAHRAVSRLLRGCLTQLQHGVDRRDTNLLGDLEALWVRESERVPPLSGDDPEVSWPEVLTVLPQVLRECRVIIDNSESLDRLDFDTPKDQVVIAVGGNTLSRGLTLEGLSVSYFVRSASAYDTLLQMGRWFGYRPGYADLTRIWLTDEMEMWFRDLATVEAEIRREITRYEAENLRPIDVGVRIRVHPKMAITAAAKMRSAVTASISYSGTRLQTIRFHEHNLTWLRENEDAARWLARQTRWEKNVGTTQIHSTTTETVIGFLGRYRIHESSHDLNSERMRDYLLTELANRNLTEFKVAYVDGPRYGDPYTYADGITVHKMSRTPLAHPPAGEAYIKVLMSPTDRWIDLQVAGSPTVEAATGLRNRGSAAGGDGSGLLLVYAISESSTPARSGGTRRKMQAPAPIIGMGIVFPISADQPRSYMTADFSKVEIEEPDDAVESEDSE